MSTPIEYTLKLTLAGRKLDMTSPTFCVGGPAGGGGAPGVADPVTIISNGLYYLWLLDKELYSIAVLLRSQLKSRRVSISKRVQPSKC